jgi:hypothetical protein
MCMLVCGLRLNCPPRSAPMVSMQGRVPAGTGVQRLPSYRMLYHCRRTKKPMHACQLTESSTRTRPRILCPCFALATRCHPQAVRPVSAMVCLQLLWYLQSNS